MIDLNISSTNRKEELHSSSLRADFNDETSESSRLRNIRYWSLKNVLCRPMFEEHFAHLVWREGVDGRTVTPFLQFNSKDDEENSFLHGSIEKSIMSRMKIDNSPSRKTMLFSARVGTRRHKEQQRIRQIFEHTKTRNDSTVPTSPPNL